MFSLIISLIISLIVVALIVYVVFWGFGEIGLPAPFDKIIRVIVVVAAVIWLISVLLPLAGITSLK